jgi:hypothetical protein
MSSRSWQYIFLLGHLVILIGMVAVLPQTIINVAPGTPVAKLQLAFAICLAALLGHGVICVGALLNKWHAYNAESRLRVAEGSGKRPGATFFRILLAWSGGPWRLLAWAVAFGAFTLGVAAIWWWGIATSVILAFSMSLILNLLAITTYRYEGK